MDRHLIPYLQVVIDHGKKNIIQVKVREYSFEFRHTNDHCDVTVAFDSISGCVIINQVYQGENGHEDNDDLSIDALLLYIS